MKREMAALYVQLAMESKIDDLKMMFDESVKEWTKEAGKPKGSAKAKYAKLVAQSAAIKDLSVSDPVKFRRGYAVLMWDQHNLRGALKRVLSQVVAEAPTVDFAAQTVQKNSSLVFLNPAYEKKSVVWKAMYRTGKVPAAAGVEVARAWLKEL